MFLELLLFLSDLELILLSDVIELFLSLGFLLNLEQVLKEILFLTRFELCLVEIDPLILSKLLVYFAEQTESSTVYRRLRRMPRFLLEKRPLEELISQALAAGGAPHPVLEVEGVAAGDHVEDGRL